MTNLEAGWFATLRKNIYYSLPKIAVTSLFAPIYVVQGIYAKHYGVALTTIAGVLLFARLFDAFTDPLIGFISDKYRIKNGTRKPFMIAGGLVLAVSGYFLYSPPAVVSTAYFAFWYIMLYLGLTLFEIPHLAWGGEISPDSYQKNQTFFFRTIAASIGLLIFYATPLLPIWDTTEITPDTLHFIAVSSGILLPPLLYICMKKVPVGVYSARERLAGNTAKTVSLRQRLAFVIDNKPLLLFLCAFVFSGMGLGMWYGMLFIYIDAYLDMGAVFAQAYVVSIIVGIFASFLWLKIANYIGKKQTWILALLLGIASFIYASFLDSNNVTYTGLLILFILSALCLVCVESLPQSMLSDIVDYSTLKYQENRGSSYFALFAFTYKANLALGGALGLAIAGWYGFDPAASTHSAATIGGLMLAVAWVPTLFTGVSMIFIALSPISSRRHFIIRRRLEMMANRV